MKLRTLLVGIGSLLALLIGATAAAQKKYDIGASDSEIRIGQTMPYSGPASAYGTIGRAQVAYFQWLNDQGGINGRKVTLISLDDGYSPPKTVEQTRRLVEQEEVLFLFQVLGTPGNTAIQRYLNAMKVPQLFVATGATKWGQPKKFPWTMGWQPSYHHESTIYAQYIIRHKPNAKIAVLYQNDDYGKDYLFSLRAGLGDQTRLIVREASYEVTDASIDSQIVSLQASGADTLVIFATPKFAAQALRKTHDIGWQPLKFLNNVSTSVAAVLQPAGLDKSIGVITSVYLKDPSDPHWSKDKGFREWVEWMKRYYPQGDMADVFNVYGYTAAQTLAYVLRQCGDDLTRENIMRQAATIKDLELPLLLPGVKIATSAADFYPIEQMQMARFDGKRWVPFGPIMTGH